MRERPTREIQNPPMGLIVLGVTGAKGSERRRQAWASYVGRIFRDVTAAKGWALPRIANEVGVAKSTLYRWKNADPEGWPPKPESVSSLINGLGLGPEAMRAAAVIIGWVGEEPADAPPPAPLDQDVQNLLRKLQDPDVPDTEKNHIRDMIRYLATRPAPDPPRGDRKRRAATG